MDPNEELAPRPAAMDDMRMIEAFSLLAELMGAMSSGGGDYPERLGQPSSGEDYPETQRQPICRYYTMSGRCNLGASCKDLHIGQGDKTPLSIALNIHGYPLRPGEKKCSYYVKTGKCKFGATCKFHHPLPAGHAPVRPAASASTQPNDGASLVVPIPSFPALLGSSSVSGFFADLPQEVVPDILLRLPLKSIGRLRCVSKPWLSVLSNYEFVKAHLAHRSHIAHEQKLLLLSYRPSLFSLTPHPGGNHLTELEFFDKQVNSLVGSCNGLVLVATKGRIMWVINCMTQEYVKLPGSPFGLCPHLCFKQYGLGYDSSGDDYKVIKISQCDYGQSDEPNCPDIFIDIYSLRTGSWKRLGTPLYGHDLLSHYDCVFMNGAFHYLGLKFKYSHKQSAVIIAFDLSSETFTEIPAPASVNDSYSFLLAKLMVVDGCLAMVVRPYAARTTEIWLMKSYKMVESWTKLVVDIKPLCSHEDKILFKDELDGILKWYHVKDGRKEVCLAKDGGLPLRVDQGITYSESLVSPHFNYHHN